MKLLFDQNLSFKPCQALADLFSGASAAIVTLRALRDSSEEWAITQDAP